MGCIAPSLVLTSQAASQFGSMAEALIAASYLRNVGRPAFFPTPGSSKDFSTSPTASATRRFTRRSCTNHRHSDVTDPYNVRRQAGEDPRPHDLRPAQDGILLRSSQTPPPESRRVKRRSLSCTHLCQSFNLPYIPGIQWDPNTKISLFSGGLLGIEVDVTFHFFMLQPGLIVYEICVEGKSRPLTNREIAFIVAVVLLAPGGSSQRRGCHPVLIPLLI